MLLKLWPIIHFQLDQLLHECSIFAVLIVRICSPCKRHNCFLPCSSRQFSLLPGRIHSSCVSPQAFPFLFWKHHKILHKPMILLAVCTFNFFKATFLLMVQFLFTAFGTCLSSSILSYIYIYIYIYDRIGI